MYYMTKTKIKSGVKINNSHSLCKKYKISIKASQYQQCNKAAAVQAN